MKLNLLNKTPHVITVRFGGGIQVIEPQGKPVRVSSKIGDHDCYHDCVEILKPSSHLALQNLPPFEANTLVVVSQIAALVAAQLHPWRKDIVYPATSKYHGAERDARGVISVSKFIRAS